MASIYTDSMGIREAIRTIDPKREYNLTHIRDERLFPWTKDQNIRSIRKIVLKDYWGENMLKALVSGTGREIEYRIKGENIIKFLKMYGPGLMMAGSDKVKTNVRKTRDSSGSRTKS